MQNRFNITFNPKVVEDLEKLDEKIKETESDANHKPETANKLKMAKLLRGMQLTNGQNGIRFNGIPY